MQKKQARVTSADVARASGVSQATVSYVLNHDPRQSIATETRERVFKAAEELGYRPFTPARILRSGYSQLVLVVLQFEQVDPGLAQDLKELEARLADRGFSLIWHVGLHNPAAHTHPSANLTPAVIVSYVDETDPVIATFLRQFNVPIVTMSNPIGRQAVGKAQVAYLAQQHQRRIIFAAPERPDLQKLAQARLEGVQQACATIGLEPPLVQMIPATRAGAQAAIQNLLIHTSPPFGICCYNDEVAFAVLAALADAGIAVPASVAVIGCDDIPLAQFSQPPLTTIGFNNQAFLDQLLENILAASRGEPSKDAPPVPLMFIQRASA